MTEYISRDAAIEAVCCGCNEQFDGEPCEPSCCSIRERLKAIPAADVVEVRKGRWIQHYVGQERTPWGSDCSVCGEWLVIDRLVMQEKYHYCPNCGAWMEES